MENKTFVNEITLPMSDMESYLNKICIQFCFAVIPSCNGTPYTFYYLNPDLNKSSSISCSEAAYVEHKMPTNS